MKRAGLLHAKEDSSSRGAVDRQQVGFDCGRRSTFPHTHIQVQPELLQYIGWRQQNGAPSFFIRWEFNVSFQGQTHPGCWKKTVGSSLLLHFDLLMPLKSFRLLVDRLSALERPTPFSWSGLFLKGKRLKILSFVLLKRPNDNFVFPVFFVILIFFLTFVFEQSFGGSGTA